MPEPLFEMSNQHTASCGQLPAVEADLPGTYHGYFSNEHGEQAIYVYGDATCEATIRMGDAGWYNVQRVVDGRVEGVTVDRAEAARIRPCWLATGALQERFRHALTLHGSRSAAPMLSLVVRIGSLEGVSTAHLVQEPR